MFIYRIVYPNISKANHPKTSSYENLLCLSVIFSFFLNPLVLLGIPLADLLDFRLALEPTLRTTVFPLAVGSREAEVDGDSPSLFWAANNSAHRGLEGILPIRPFNVSSLCISILSPIRISKEDRGGGGHTKETYLRPYQN